MNPKKYEVSTCRRLRHSEAGACFYRAHPLCDSFQGGREVSDFISYLKREATNPLVMQEESKKKKKKKKDDDDKIEL